MINIKVEEVNGGREVHQTCRGLGSEIVRDLEYAVASVLIQIMPNMHTDLDARVNIMTTFALNVCTLVDTAACNMETKSLTTVHTTPGFDALIAKIKATYPPVDDDCNNEEESNNSDTINKEEKQ